MGEKKKEKKEHIKITMIWDLGCYLPTSHMNRIQINIDITKAAWKINFDVLFENIAIHKSLKIK